MNAQGALPIASYRPESEVRRAIRALDERYGSGNWTVREELGGERPSYTVHTPRTVGLVSAPTAREAIILAARTGEG